MLDLDLSHYHQYLKITKSDSKQTIFDPVRKKHYVLLPEELVRQTWICYLHEAHNISFAALGAEKQLDDKGSSKRYDLVYYKKGKPHILFEFKSYKSKLSQSVAHQAADYNLHLKVPYMVLSNGLISFLYQIDFDNQAVVEIKEFLF